MATGTLFSIAGQSLKLDTAADIEKHIAGLISNDKVEEVRFEGNTLGVGACERLAEVLKTKKTLKVI
jgi:Ran GTPase-activating protein 1